MKRAALFLVLFLAACGVSPEPDYYDLAKVNGTPLPGVALSIKIQRPSLPDYLDRPDIVSEENAYRYRIDEMRRWAEPLDRMFERILTEDLRQRLPDSRILPESDTGTTNLRYVVETDIEQFNTIGKDEASLKAVLSINDKTATTAIQPEHIQLTAPANGSMAALAAALSNLIGAYADTIQVAIQQQALRRDRR